MKAYLYYCEKSSLNDATNYYISIINKSLFQKGIILFFTDQIQQLTDADFILTITVKAFFKAKMKNKKAKTIFWFQGIAPEEAIMESTNIKNLYRYTVRRILTHYALNNADLLFFVSDAMKEHFSKKYGYKKNNYIIMPCYNLPLSPIFNPNQYSSPTFVYAGGTSVWQGIYFMLDVYSLIEKQISNAHLTLLCKNKKLLEKELSQRNINNYNIKYVSMDSLQDELHKYKYGFIIRDNHVVNKVATPTKMNSYLSNYLIPIFSDTVYDFNKYINLGKYTLKIKYPFDAQAIAREIIDFENKIHNYDEYKEIVKDVFRNHYNDDMYIGIISNMIGQLFNIK